MNILFFLTPKSQVKFIDDTMSVRQALEVMDFYRYSTIPLLTKDGKLVGTISEGDLLFYLKSHPFSELSELADFDNHKVLEVKRHKDYLPVKIDVEMNDLISNAVNQNFVPVIDDQMNFIGIVTRKSIINYLYLQK